MSWFVFVALLTIFIGLISRVSAFRFAEINRYYSIIYFVVKIVFAFALWAVYTYYYTDRKNSDLYKFFDDGKTLHNLANENPQLFVAYFWENKNETSKSAPLLHWSRNFNNRMPFNENRLMIRLHTMLHFVSLGNIHTHQLFFCFLSYLGAVGIFNFSLLVFAFLPLAVRLLCISFPSFLFWTSAALKEAVLLFALGVFLYSFYLFLQQKKIGQLLLSIAALLLLVYIKTIVGLIVGFCTVLLLLFYQKNKWLTIGKYIAGGIAAIAFIAMLSEMGYIGQYASYFYYKQFDAVNEAVAANANSISTVPLITKNILSLLPAYPLGIVYGLFKPFPSFTKNPLLLLSMAENLFFLVLLLFAIAAFFRKKVVFQQWDWVVWINAIAIIYIGLLGILTPVVGNLVRYRAVVMPLLFFTLTAIIFTKKINDIK